MLSYLYVDVKPDSPDSWTPRFVDIATDPFRPPSDRWPAAEHSLGEQELVSREGHRDGRSVDSYDGSPAGRPAGGTGVRWTIQPGFRLPLACTHG